MDESGRRQRVARTDGELATRGAAELVVNERENLVERLGAPGTQLIPKLGDGRRRRRPRGGLLRSDHSISIRELTILDLPAGVGGSSLTVAYPGSGRPSRLTSPASVARRSITSELSCVATR